MQYRRKQSLLSYDKGLFSSFFFPPKKHFQPPGMLLPLCNNSATIRSVPQTLREQPESAGGARLFVLIQQNKGERNNWAGEGEQRGCLWSLVFKGYDESTHQMRLRYPAPRRRAQSPFHRQLKAKICAVGLGLGLVWAFFFFFLALPGEYLNDAGLNFGLPPPPASTITAERCGWQAKAAPSLVGLQLRACKENPGRLARCKAGAGIPVFPGTSTLHAKYPFIILKTHPGFNLGKAKGCDGFAPC